MLSNLYSIQTSLILKTNWNKGGFMECILIVDISLLRQKTFFFI